ncbi:MAG TPA: hypothetical protein PL033_15135 [Candidatus Brocadiia bacterium]|nr:hypothetical protein [Candidatus Brocadiia bacterium]
MKVGRLHDCIMAVQFFALRRLNPLAADDSIVSRICSDCAATRTAGRLRQIERSSA